MYDHKRTQEIVEKLVKIGNILRLCIITSALIFFISLFIFLFETDLDETLLIPLAIGGFLGYFIGRIIASFTTISLEWMAQLLIIQDKSLSSNLERTELFSKIAAKRQPKQAS